MVPMLSVILHMIHTLAAQEDELEKSIPTATCTWDSALAAKQLFISHANSVVKKAVEMEDGTIIGKAKRMKDLVAEYWDQLTGLATVELLTGNEDLGRESCTAGIIWMSSWASLTSGGNKSHLQATGYR